MNTPRAYLIILALWLVCLIGLVSVVAPFVHAAFRSVP